MAKGRSRAKVEGCRRRHRRRSGHPLATLSSADRKDEMRAPALGRRSMRLEGSPPKRPKPLFCPNEQLRPGDTRFPFRRLPPGG